MIQSLLRELTPQVLSAVMRRFGDFGACEDAVQEALIAAVTQWPRDGVPDNPRGWLVSVAARRITDQVRAEAARRHREQIVVSLVPVEEQIASLDQGSDRDDTLELLFTCCHPSLSVSSAIALTLRALSGLTTLEIAKAFLVPEATMAQRISRAKETIKASGIGFEAPSAEAQTARLASVMHVLYLIFNEGYIASSGATLVRDDLAHEAIRLTRMLVQVVPENAEARGLLALMLLTDARRRARVGVHGELIPLDELTQTPRVLTLETMPEKSPFNLKGNAWRGMRDFCDEMVPGGVRAVCAAMPTPAARNFFAQFFIPSVWYDVMPFAEVADAAGALIGCGAAEFCERIGKFVLERDMSGIYRALLHFAAPELMARTLPLASKRYFDFVTMKLEFVETRHFIMHLSGIPRIVALPYTRVTQVFTQHAITGSGGKDVSVTTSDPVDSAIVHGIQTVTLERHVRWD